MSDIFDHEADAWDSLDRSIEEADIGRYQSIDRDFVLLYSKSCTIYDFCRDPLFYHRKIKIKGIVAETEKAYLFKIKKKVGFWVPKSMCRRLKKKSVYVHRSVIQTNKPVLLGL